MENKQFFPENETSAMKRYREFTAANPKQSEDKEFEERVAESRAAKRVEEYESINIKALNKLIDDISNKALKDITSHISMSRRLWNAEFNFKYIRQCLQLLVVEGSVQLLEKIKADEIKKI